MRAKKVEYKGEETTIGELSKMSGVPSALIHNRLKYGWSVEDSVLPPQKPSNSVRKQPLMSEFENGNIVEAVFRTPVSVYPHMRPKLNKRYVVTAHTALKSSSPTYTITLENGKILIVYPEEFEIVNVIQRENDVLLAAE